jgi:hypothetical protein
MTPPANPSDNYNKTFFPSLTSKLCCFPLQAFPSSLIFASTVGAYLCRKGLPRTNTLAYLSGRRKTFYYIDT